MKQYKYTGDSIMRFSIILNGRTTEFCAEPGKCLTLPAKHPRIMQLIAKKFFVEVDSSGAEIVPPAAIPASEELSTRTEEPLAEVVSEDNTSKSAGENSENAGGDGKNDSGKNGKNDKKKNK